MIIRPAAPADHAEWLRMRLNLWGGAAEEHTHDMDAYFWASRTEGRSSWNDQQVDSVGLSKSVSGTTLKDASPHL